jgi:hypothetical protein
LKRNFFPPKQRVTLLWLLLTAVLLAACAEIEPPTVSDPKISAPTPQEPGEEIGIAVDVSNAGGANLSYEWRVDGGEIVRGQGSPAITYRTPEEPGIYNVRVAVMWGDSSVEKITTIRIEAPAVAAADTPMPEPEPPTATSIPQTDAEPPTATPVPPTATAAPPTFTPKPTNTSVPPTSTPDLPTSTPTAEPTVPPVPLAGIETIPISNLEPAIPWLPWDPNNIPVTYYYGFNLSRPPFDNVLVRQAFASALDREVIANVAGIQGYREVQPATTFVPATVLGRNLYGEIGHPFNPDRAREVLAQAGYPDGEGFPQVTLVFNNTETHQTVAGAAVSMWRDNLGVNVGTEAIDDWDSYLERLRNDTPAIYRLGWAADYNDPENFFKHHVSGRRVKLQPLLQ